MYNNAGILLFMNQSIERNSFITLGKAISCFLCSFCVPTAREVNAYKTISDEWGGEEIQVVRKSFGRRSFVCEDLNCILFVCCEASNFSCLMGNFSSIV
jgi:hypothetical protein